MIDLMEEVEDAEVGVVEAEVGVALTLVEVEVEEEEVCP